MTDTPEQKSLHVTETCKENAGSFAIDEKALERAAKVLCRETHEPITADKHTIMALDLTLNANLYSRLARAAITAYLAARAEAGFVEVPREPTYEMASEGDSVMPQFSSHPDYAGLTGYDVAIEVYRAMLAKGASVKPDPITTPFEGPDGYAAAMTLGD